MDELKIFQNKVFGKVRTYEENGKIYFVGKDVAVALGYSNTRKAIIDHVDEEDKGVTKRDTIGGFQEMTVINESGLYSLILSSKLQSAKLFKRWITLEVIPSIRRNGGYIANQENLTNEQILANAMVVAKNVIAQKDKQIQTMQPKADSFDRFISAENLQTMSDAAKSLGYGRNTLYSILRKYKVLMSDNMPYQKYIDHGYFSVKQTTIEIGDKPIDKTQTFVTPKGIIWLSKGLKRMESE